MRFFKNKVLYSLFLVYSNFCSGQGLCWLNLCNSVCAFCLGLLNKSHHKHVKKLSGKGTGSCTIVVDNDDDDNADDDANVNDVDDDDDDDGDNNVANVSAAPDDDYGHVGLC